MKTIEYWEPGSREELTIICPEEWTTRGKLETGKIRKD